MVETQSIVVLDFGAQYSQLIARRIREQNVFSVVLPCTASLDEIRELLTRGHHSVGRPVVGLRRRRAPGRRAGAASGPARAGHLLRTAVHGVQAGRQSARRRQARVRPRRGRAAEQRLAAVQGLRGPVAVWMSHGDEALELPAGFELVAKTSNAVAAIQNPATHLVCGAVSSRSPPHAAGHRNPAQLRLRHLRLQADLDAAAASSTRPSPASARQSATAASSAALSGGVDSSVAAELVHRAIGDQLTCIFVNNGVLRKNEFQQGAEEPARQARPEHRSRSMPASAS